MRKDGKKLIPEEQKLREDKAALKKYLSQVYLARKRKRQLEERLKYIKQEVTGPIGGKGYSPLPNHGSTISAGAASYVYRLAEIEQRIYDQRDQVEMSILKVMDIMDFLPEQSTERMILELRYVDCKRWEQITKEMNLTRTPCNDYFNKALELLLSFRKVQKIVQEIQENTKTGD